MIFLTVGLEKFPFDRLLRAVDRGVEDGTIRGSVFGQIGHSRYVPRHYGHCRFLPFDQMRTRLGSADAVVCHGGVGTILLALELGKIPLVVPRRAAYGEQVDDHQLDLVSRLEAAGRILVAGTEEALPEMLARHGELNERGRARPAASPEFDALVGFLRSTLQVGHGS